MGSAIRIENLTRDFGTIRAVDDLSLVVEEGSVFGFLGPNGAGKTTTINVLLGLLAPTEGRADVLGFDTARSGDEVRARCGVLLEDTGLYENLTALENLEFHGRMWGLSREVRSPRIEQLLSDAGMWPRRNDVVGTWSQGMRRRLGLIRALLSEPQVLFLDEPTAGLDVLAAREVRRDLTETAGRVGMTIFLTTHNMAEAEKLCDTVGVLQRGRLIAVGPPDHLTSGRHNLVRVRGEGFTTSVVESLRRHAGVVTVEVLGPRTLRVDLSEATVAEIISLLVGRGAAIEEATPERVTLEDAFVDLLREGT